MWLTADDLQQHAHVLGVICLLWNYDLPIITVLSTAQYSGHQFSSAKEERAALIFNYKPTDVQDYLPFVQAYFF